MKVEPNLLTETKQIIKQQIDLHSLFFQFDFNFEVEL